MICWQIHIVRFDSSNRIESVCQYWDQGSLLKQCEVIGTRGRNWPIRDATEQTRLILVHAAQHAPPARGRVPAPIQPIPSAEGERSTERAPSPSKRHIKDPHASLVLFGDSAERDPAPRAIAPRAPSSAKPLPRQYDELFVGDGDNETTPTKNPIAVVAPKVGSGKNYQPIRVIGESVDDQTETAVAPKAGSSRNYHPIRLFDVEDPNSTLSTETTELRYKSDPKKYQHFELGENNNGERELKHVPSNPKSQHMSQWDFSDFTTPQKLSRKVRQQDVRHFGWSDDEAEAMQPTPPPRPHVPQPRRDAEAHFQFEDDDDAVAPAPQRTIGDANHKGLGLYENNLYDEEGTPHGAAAPTAPGLQPSGSHREKDFGSHFLMADNSPEQGEEQHLPRPSTGDHSQAIKMMNSSWDTYDESPQPQKDISSLAQAKRQSRNPNQRSWEFGDGGDY